MGEQSKFEQGQFFDTKELEKMWATLDFDRWRDFGIKIKRTEGRGERYISQLAWTIGDWLLVGKENAGKKRGGKKWGSMRDVREEAVAIWKKPWGTLKNYMGTAKTFPKAGSDSQKSRRRDILFYSTHYHLRKLTEDERDKWLDRCTENRWTLKSLKKAMRQEKVREKDHRVPKTFTVTFSSNTCAVLRHMLTVDSRIREAACGRHYPTVESLIVWLTGRGLAAEGWIEKGNEYLKEAEKERQADATKRAEQEARWQAHQEHLAAREKFSKELKGTENLSRDEYISRMRAWDKDYIAQHEAGGTKESNHESSVEIAERRP